MYPAREPARQRGSLKAGSSAALRASLQARGPQAAQSLPGLLPRLPTWSGWPCTACSLRRKACTAARRRLCTWGLRGPPLLAHCARHRERWRMLGQQPLEQHQRLCQLLSESCATYGGCPASQGPCQSTFICCRRQPMGTIPQSAAAQRRPCRSRSMRTRLASSAGISGAPACQECSQARAVLQGLARPAPACVQVEPAPVRAGQEQPAAAASLPAQTSL